MLKIFRLLVLVGVIMLTITACEESDYAQFSEEVDKANQMLAMMQKHQTSRFSPENSASAYDSIAQAKRFAGRYQFDMAQEELDNFYRFANAAMSDSTLVLRRDSIHGVDPGSVIAEQVLTPAPVKVPVVAKAKPKAKVQGKVLATNTKPQKKRVKPVQSKVVVQNVTPKAKEVVQEPLELLAAAPVPVPVASAEPNLDLKLLPFESENYKRKTPLDPNTRTFTVRRGDWLMKIARNLGKKDLYALEIYKANKDILANPDVIEVGQQLILP